MKKRAYEFIGFIILVTLLFLIFIFFLNSDFTGNAIISIQSDFSYCDYNISCNFTNFTSGNIYCLNESMNFNDNCLSIIAENITLDLQGFTLSGESENIGLNIINSRNITIQNGNIYNCSVCVSLITSNSSFLLNLSLNNSDSGLFLQNSYLNEINNLSCYNHTNGVRFINSENNILDGLNADNETELHPRLSTRIAYMQQLYNAMKHDH